MATIDKLPSGKFRVRWRTPGGRDSAVFARRTDAVKFGRLKDAEMASGLYIDPKNARMAFGDWAARWLEMKVNLKPKTRIGYESLLKTYLLREFGRRSLGAIQPIEVREWVMGLSNAGLSASRLRQVYQLLSAIFKAAVESEFLPRSPCIGVKLPKAPKREMRFLDAEQVAILAETIRSPYETLVYLLAYGGLRWGETAGLRRGRCHLARIDIAETLSEVNGHIYFVETKSYENRRIALPAFLRGLIGEHLLRHVDDDPSSLVFTAPQGGPLRHQNFRNRVWLPALQAADIAPGFRIHDLRHTCAALLISQGAHIKALQNHLGHSSIQVTLDHYGHLYEDDLERLASGLDATYRSARSSRQKIRADTAGSRQHSQRDPSR